MLKFKFKVAALALSVAAGLASPLLQATVNIAPGTAAPDFQLPSMAGSTVALDKLKGQVVLINFWASWCGPCRAEMPKLDALYHKYQPAGFTLIGVNVEPKSNDALGFLKTTPVTFPILFDTASQVSNLYQVEGMPSTVIVDRKGVIRYVHRSYKPGDEDAYLDQIRALVRE